MTQVIVNQGETLSLQYLVAAATPQDLVLRLFQNDVVAGLTPSQIDALTEADMTEATFTGYAAITLSGAGWNAPVEGDPSVIDFAQQEFTSTADQAQQTIYGYYYTRATGGEMVSFEYFAAPAVVEFNNDKIRVTPTITGQDTQD